MVTIDELKRKIKEKEDKIATAERKRKLELEKSNLSRQLKLLQRSPATSKNIELARRTARGFKRLAGIGGRALVKQVKLIKDQQLREDAVLARRQKKITKTVKKAGKKLRKASKKRRKKLSKKGPGKSVTLTFG